MQYNPQVYKAYQLMHNGILALARAEQSGMRVDLEYIERKKAHLTRRIERLEDSFKQTKFYHHWEHSTNSKININSNIQLSHFLYGVKKLKPEKLTISGQGATDEEALQQLNMPELDNLLEIRKLKKVKDTYLDSFTREQVDGFIHPFFNLHLVRTYRSSSDHPNFQNIPVRDEESMQICRKALYPRIGHQLMEIDFKGIEVAVNACYNKDPNLIKYVSNPKSDMHIDMARQIFMIDKFNRDIPSHEVLRQAAKNGFVFPEFYGDYYKNCAYNMACSWGKLPQGKWQSEQGILLQNEHLSDHLILKGINSLTKFEEHLKAIEEDFWDNRFPNYRKWKERWWKQYQRQGYIDLLTGFRCSGVMTRNEVTNSPGQGSAFHCLLWAFIEMDKTLRKLDSRLVSQIHDSMIVDLNPSELNLVVKLAKQITCEALPQAWTWIIVPMDIKIEISPIDKSWAEKVKFELK